jgi:adenylate cyclase
VRDVADVLKQREAQGLQLLIGLQIAGALLLGLALILFVQSAVPARILLVGVGVLPVLIAALIMVRRGYRVALAGHVAILLAFAITGPMIHYAEWTSAGIDVVSAAYMAKTGYPVGFVLIALTGLTLQPHYPLATTALMVVFQLTLLAIALDDPRTVLTDQHGWRDHVMGSALHLGKVANLMTMTVLIGAVITLATWIARRTVISAARLEKANGQLRRYFSPDVAEQVASADADFLKPGGRLKKVVVLTSDIAGFTRLASALGPDATMRVLSDYQQRMTEAIFRNGGSVDKFIGDGILATFGATGSMPDPNARAISAARDMMAALDALNAGRAQQRQPAISHRIGLHAGEAMVGNVGSSDRLEFTVIGDVVNLASRIEAACKRTGDAVLLSDAVYSGCPDVQVTSRGRVSMPGVDNPPELFALDAARPA